MWIDSSWVELRRLIINISVIALRKIVTVDDQLCRQPEMLFFCPDFWLIFDSLPENRRPSSIIITRQNFSRDRPEDNFVKYSFQGYNQFFSQENYLGNRLSWFHSLQESCEIYRKVERILQDKNMSCKNLATNSIFYKMLPDFKNIASSCQIFRKKLVRIVFFSGYANISAASFKINSRGKK